MRRILAWMLALLLVGAAALAEQRAMTTGNVNLRYGPGLDHEIQTAVPEGTALEYLGETAVDGRGVAWYRVLNDGERVWVSSRYAELEEGGAPSPSSGAEEGQAPYRADDVELLSFYRTNLAAAVKTLKLTDYAYVESESPHRYSDGAVTLSGWESVDCMLITGPGYALCGAAVGMPLAEARAALTEAGLTLYQDGDGGFSVTYPGGNEFFTAVGDHGGIVHVTGANGRVTEIDLESYTG